MPFLNELLYFNQGVLSPVNAAVDYLRQNSQSVMDSNILMAVLLHGGRYGLIQ